MPLSERDQIVLYQIEHDLRAGDPKLALALAPAGVRSGERRSMLAGVLVGMTLVLAGLIAKIIILSVLGFLVLVVVAQAVTKPSTLGAARRRSAPRPPSH